MRFLSILIISFLALTGCQGPSDLKLPSLIGDNMVLQQKTDAKIWGKALPGHKITVEESWNKSAKTKSSEAGKWAVILPVPEAGGPYTLKISSNDTTITVNNVLVGEVWFCSGQSNMEMPLAGWPPNDTIMHSSQTISSSAINEIRLFNVQKKISGEPLEDCIGKWEISSPETAAPFSATATFFGRKLYSELKVPVGLIESAWGGTPSESWTSSSALENCGEFVPEIKAIKESVPLLAVYEAWLHSLEQVVPSAAGVDQYKDLKFNDETASSEQYSDSEWPVIELPSQFEKSTGEFDGAVWFRKQVELGPEVAGKDLILSLGPIDDMDRAFFNGTLVGSTEETGKWQADRLYDVPASLVKAGTNLISVRVIDTQGGGGIYGAPEKMKLTVKNNSKVYLPLNGEWKYQPVAEYSGSRFYLFGLGKNDFKTIKRPVSLGAGTPSVLYNGMVKPVVPYTIKGAIWYQGESNVSRSAQYDKIFPAMIQNWREEWGLPDFPFYFVQIAPYVYSNVDSTESAFLRESQEKALKLAKTGMVSTLDIATVMNIHPPDKKGVGERLAMLALNNDYGVKYNSIGPVFKSVTIEKNLARLKFDNAEDGLVGKGKNLNEFEVAGTDGKWVKAKAEIAENEVIVSSPSVSQPVSVRYCWRNGSEASLFNKAGFPAWQFRTK